MAHKECFSFTEVNRFYLLGISMLLKKNSTCQLQQITFGHIACTCVACRSELNNVKYFGGKHMKNSRTFQSLLALFAVVVLGISVAAQQQETSTTPTTQMNEKSQSQAAATSVTKINTRPIRRTRHLACQKVGRSANS